MPLNPLLCWKWKANTNSDGYGTFWFNKKMTKAHRVSWEIHKGPIPVGKQVLHTCDNPPCVNPEHLFLGTNTDNVQDKVFKYRQAKGLEHRNKSGCYKTSNMQSKFKGVSWNKENKKWEVQAKLNNKKKFLGYFDNEIEASEKYRDFVNKIEEYIC